MTIKQDALLYYICRHVERNGFQPSTRDMGVAFGITCQAVYDRLSGLDRAGLVRLGREHRRGHSRALQITDAGWEAAQANEAFGETK